MNMLRMVLLLSMWFSIVYRFDPFSKLLMAFKGWERKTKVEL